MLLSLDRLRLLLAGLVFLCGGAVWAAEQIPPAPEQYFNDYAGVVSSDTSQRLNSALQALEQSDSTQILVAVYPKMESDSSIEDYTVRVARAWGVGQAQTNNGAILFVFIEDRAMRIEVGYGLEGAIPDAVAKRIIEEEIGPHFRAGNYEQGLAAGVQALIQAARGEYQGSGRTVGTRSGRQSIWVPILVFIFIFLGIIGRTRRRRGYMYRRGGRTMWAAPFIGGFGRGGGGGGGFGGGFSGGGGSFGGGGASGSW